MIKQISVAVFFCVTFWAHAKLLKLFNIRDKEIVACPPAHCGCIDIFRNNAKK